jgi:hypothetical protein
VRSGFHSVRISGPDRCWYHRRGPDHLTLLRRARWLLTESRARGPANVYPHKHSSINGWSGDIASTAMVPRLPGGSIPVNQMDAELTTTATRRTVINWADSAFAITTLPAAASASDDPRFALLDAHGKAEHAYTFPSMEVDKDDPALLQQFTDLGDEVDELAWDIARNEPSTIAGVAAVLRYVSNIDPDGGRWPHQEYGWPGTLHASLARALKRIVR